MNAVHLSGIPVYGDEVIGRDKMVGSEAGIWVHPLTIITMKHRRDPIGELHEAMEWIVARAHRKLDAVAEALGVTS